MKLSSVHLIVLFVLFAKTICFDRRNVLDLDVINDSRPVANVCDRGNYQISHQEQLNEIVDCSVIQGDVVITDFSYPILDLGKVETITGNLVISKSPDIVRIESEKLTNVGNELKLSELTSLSVIVFPSLSSVKIITWKVLPILSAVQFFNEINDLSSVTVSDTSLTGFSGFLTEKLKVLDINNNRFLDSITSNVEVIDESLHISANSFGTTVSLPNLRIANNMSIQDVSEINLPSLEYVQNSVSLINNPFRSLKFSNLKSIGGTLNIFKNKKLVELEFPSITEVGGGLIIANNSNIEKINFFPKLNVIGGALEIIGNIREISIKQLKLVKGSTKLKTDYQSFDCNLWLHSEIISVIRGGKIECLNANNEKFITNTPTFSNGTEQENYDDGTSNFEQFQPQIGNTTLNSFAVTTLYSVINLFVMILVVCMFST
jgi:hypothetical protein